jgi:two-component system NtrC family sensor kinase
MGGLALANGLRAWIVPNASSPMLAHSTSDRVSLDRNALVSHEIGGRVPIDKGRPSQGSDNRSDRRGYNASVKRTIFSRLSTRLTLGVAGLVGVLLVAMAVTGGALYTAYRALQECIALTGAEREAVAIGAAAREQYIHESHGILTRDEVHVSHDRQWATELAQRVARLRPVVGETERHLLDRVQSTSSEMQKAFAERVFPAAVAGDLDRVRAGYEDVERYREAMVRASDRAVEHLASKEHKEAAFAFERARVASVTAVVTTAIALLIAGALAAALIRGIVRPLAALSAAAARIGQGDFTATSPPTGAAEFEELRAGLERMAAQLQERETKLLEAERLAGLGALAAGVAHELNNPLGVILGYTTTLRRGAVDAETAEDLRIIEEETHQCRRIVEDLVTFAREPRLERVTIDLPSLIRDVVSRLERAGELAPGIVRLEGARIADASVDGTRVGQVLRNLLLNAAAAAPEGTPIEVRVEDGSDQIAVHVRDQGGGISREDLPHLFEPFFSKRPGGTGLGLAVSHGIVMAHGGTIQIDSASGCGTTATIRLPKIGGERQ